MPIDWPGALGDTGNGLWEAIHADWPAYPGDHSRAHALLRFADFPPGTEFTCIDVIDQSALLVAEVGIREVNLFSEKHMHVAVWLDDLAGLDEQGLVDGVTFDQTLSYEQLSMKRTLGPTDWERFRSGDMVLVYQDKQGVTHPIPVPPDEEPDEEWIGDGPPAPNPEQMAIFPTSRRETGTKIKLRPNSSLQVEYIAKMNLEIPQSLHDRVSTLLKEELFDSAVRDLGAALETRMRTVCESKHFGMQLVDQYIKVLLDSGEFLPARIKTLRQELRSIFKFVRNEFAHNLVDVPPGRGYALVSRMCWHVRDIEIATEQLPS